MYKEQNPQANTGTAFFWAFNCSASVHPWIHILESEQHLNEVIQCKKMKNNKIRQENNMHNA